MKVHEGNMWEGLDKSMASVSSKVLTANFPILGASLGDVGDVGVRMGST